MKYRVLSVFLSQLEPYNVSLDPAVEDQVSQVLDEAGIIIPPPPSEV